MPRTRCPLLRPLPLRERAAPIVQRTQLGEGLQHYPSPIPCVERPSSPLPQGERAQQPASRLWLGATATALALALALLRAPAAAEEAVTPERVQRGADIYARNCSPCHGPRLKGEDSAFDL